MLARSRRHGSGVAALYVDLDDFKTINDNFGHAAGDDVLRAIGARLSTVVRVSDIAGRLGGDEFVLLDDLKLEDEAARIAQRIDRLLEAPIESAALPGQELHVVASVGVAVTYQGTFDELLSDADRAMYDVKRSRKRSAAAAAAAA
jgi:diguanylate cyclase (GGDEF)-like protein